MFLTSPLTRTGVTSWQPDELFAATSVLESGEKTLMDQTGRVSAGIDALQQSDTWTGTASDAARVRIDRIGRSADQNASTVSAIRAEITAGAYAISACRARLLTAVAVAEADLCLVGDDWSLTAADAAVIAVHRVEIDACLADLVRADREAADAVVRAADRLVGSTGVRNFVPILIGAALLVELAVDALIAAGVVSLGALLFALVDRFGEGAWNTIHDAVPDSFFSDAGPVDRSSVQDALKADTDPGRSDGYRQVESSGEVTELYEKLTAEGRPLELGSYPGVGEQLPDGTEIRMRNTSKSGGPTIDIKYPDGTITKVHVQ